MSNRPDLKTTLDGPLDYIAARIKQGWAARIIIIVLVLGSIGVIWWSINERLALLYGAKSIIHQQADIERSIDHLKMNWSAQNHDQIAAELKIAENKLMPDQHTLADWLGNHIVDAKKKRIQLIYNVGRAHPTAEKLGNVHLVPIQIILRPTKSMSQNSAYKKILAFVKRITGSKWRMDVSSATATGRGEAFNQLELHIEMWMKDDSSLNRGNGA